MEIIFAVIGYTARALPYLVTIGAIVFVLVVLGAFALPVLASIFGSRRTNSWLTTIGVIISAEVAEHEGSKRIYYYPKVSYEYTANGQKYVSSRISYGSQPSGLERSQKFLENYKAGSEVVIFYSPDDPSESVLIKGSNLGIFLILAIVVAMVVFGIYAMVNVWK